MRGLTRNVALLVLIVVLASSCGPESNGCVAPSDCAFGESCDVSTGQCLQPTKTEPTKTELTLTLTATPDLALANGAATATLTVTVTDAAGAPQAGLAVSLGVTGTGNTLGASQGSTNGQGQWTTTLSSTVAETKVATATTGGKSQSVSLTFAPFLPSVTNSSLVISPSTLPADGTTRATATLTLRDENNQPYPGQAVTFSSTSAGVVFATSSATTNAAGVASVQLSSTAAGPATVRAQFGAGGLTQTVTFQALPALAANSTVTVTPSSLVADGVSQATLLVTLRDALSNPVPNAAVSLSASGIGNTLSAVSGSTDAAGHFQATLKSTAAGVKTVTATSGPLTLTVNVTFTGAPSAALSTLVVSPTLLLANGMAQTRVSATIRSATGAPVANLELPLSCSGSGNILSATRLITDANGHASATLKSTVAATKTVTLGSGAFSLTASVTFTAGSCGAVASSPTVTAYSTGATVSHPYSVASGDFNGDGQTDLVLGSSLVSGSVVVLLGQGSGTFGTQVPWAAGSNALSVAVADMDGDGKLDVVAGNSAGISSKVSVLKGLGNGSFAAPTSFAAGTNVQGLAVGDFNDDGLPDVVTANFGSDSVSVLLGAGAGALAAKVDYTTSTQPTAVAVGDLNGDGHQDIVAASGGYSGGVRVLVGRGDGTFLSEARYGSSSRVSQGVAIQDLNGDGKLDVVALNNMDNNASLFLGNGDGTLGTKADFPVGPSPKGLVVADLNADGKMDIATANFSGSSVSFLAGNGAGGFAAKKDWSVAGGPFGVAAADLNADGRPDLATANNSGNTVGVLLAPACTP